MQNIVINATDISNLVEARKAEQIDISWTSNGNVDKYRIYRYIGDYPHDITKDPRVDLLDSFVFIKETTSTSYTDTFNDLNLHGFTKINNVWVDSNSRDVLNQIYYTKRAIYYKIVAIGSADQVPFNALPFIFISYEGSLECRSCITQVKFNKLWHEGDKVWFASPALGTIQSIAVDPNWADRPGYVWIVTSSGNVACLNVKDGTTHKTYNLGYALYSVRVDPSTGNAIVGGASTTLTKCILTTGLTSSVGTTTQAVGTYGNYALTLKLKNNALYAYSIWDKHYILEWNVATPGIATLIPASSYGEYLATQYSPHGLCNSADLNIWLAARELINMQWTETRVGYYAQPYSYVACGPGPGYSGCNGSGTLGGKWGSLDSVTYTGVNYVPYTYTESFNESFYKDQGFIYGVGLDTTGYSISSDNFENCSRAGHTMYPCAGDIGHHSPAWDPNIHSGTFDGTKADFPVTTDTTKYSIWQADDVENGLQRITWDGATLTLTTSSISAVANPCNPAVDSENNIWGVSKDSTHKKIYQLGTDSVFPTGGFCTWPSATNLSSFNLEGSEWVYGNYNDVYIEYVLTRSPTPGDTLYDAVCAAATDATKRTLARQWIALSGYEVSGIRIFPNYVDNDTMFNVTRYNADITTQPNADETGSEYIFAADYQIYSTPLIIYPPYVNPNIELVLRPLQSTPRLNDLDFWDDQMQYTAADGCSGYDDLTVNFTASTLNPNAFSFMISGYEFKYGDKEKDICGDMGCNCADYYPDCGYNYDTTHHQYTAVLVSNTTNYLYHDPSQSGKPGERRHGTPGEVNGTYLANLTTWTEDLNCYILEGEDYAGLNWPLVTDYENVYVFERWPTAQYYIIPHDLEEIRENWYGTAGWGIADAFVAGANTSNIRSTNRIVSGYDPLSATFEDISIARTWAITSWYFNFGQDDNLYPAVYKFFEPYEGFGYTECFPPTGFTTDDYGISYTTRTATMTAATADFHPRDGETSHMHFAEHVYFKPGEYWTTLYVQACGSWTNSSIISAGITDPNIIKNFSMYTSALVIVLESCPWPNFLTVMASTVPVDYRDEYGNIVASPICAAYINSNGWFISGYAPNLTITWQDSSIARSYPISSYNWNFGDWYDEVHMLSTVEATQVLNGYPGWITDVTNNIVYHSYAMPGIYNVTLNVEASTTSTSACQICAKNLHVYVEELPQVPCFLESLSAGEGYGTTSINGESPLTVYFNPSCIVNGSFPICRIDWDFGDGSEITTVTRRPSATTIIGPIAYSNDLADPRNIIVSHTYTRETLTDPETYTVWMSSYSCNTNNMEYTSGSFGGNYNIGPLSSEDSVISIDEPKHLIASRMFDNDNKLMLVFEGEKPTTFNYIFSAGDNNV